MIHMRMGDDDMAHRAAANRCNQCIQMLIIGRTGIDHRDGIVPQNITIGAVKGERGGVVTGNAAETGRHFKPILRSVVQRPF